jgi:hypothetical protein
LPSYAAAAHVIWVIRAQKVVPDLDTALHRRAPPAAGERTHHRELKRPSAVNRVRILNAEPESRRGTILPLREAIGF